ncbi:MAG TPA: ATP-dependent RNA helicase [Rectinemataceae bacterium]|nr:ATP-dependent RNA helicase [Rectinemataceae bacterium]
MNPHELPVYQQKDKILDALKENQVIVVESPTGSGKTTQLPIILNEAGYADHGLIGVTQPRRIAVLSVSDFIGRQLGDIKPGIVGYKMRFEDVTTSSTKIKVMTDGILLQEMKLDPYLSKYDVIMVDEAHERSLNIDFILGLLKKVLEIRPTFKVIVSSATINAEVFSQYFGECPVVKIDTQTYPVTLIYDPIAEPPIQAEERPRDSFSRGRDGRDGRDGGRRDGRGGRDGRDGSAANPGGSGAPASPLRYSDEALYDKILSIVTRSLEQREEGEAGDMLIFLPGEKTIKECAMRIAGIPLASKIHIVPLYARLGKDEQGKVFDPAPEGKTKIVIATNIAETSVTIDGITVVIDSGLAKLNYYNPRTFTASLIETPISKASCNQRKGRAGRTRPGICYRLYPRKEFENRPLFTTEEIYRTDLSEVVLRMAELGISDFESFDFISKPPKSGIAGAIDILNLLDSLSGDQTLSKIGEMMCAFPLLPRLSRMIVESIMRYPDVIHETLVAAAFLSTMSPYVLPPGEEMEARKAHHAFRDPMGDFVSYLRIFDAFQAAPDKTRFCEKNYLDERTMREIVRIREQLEIIVSEMGLPILRGGSLYDYLCAVSRGLIQFVCARQERGLFRSLTAEKISIHPGSVMFRENPDFIVAGEIVRTTRMYAMSVSPLPRDILSKISPIVAERLLSLVDSRKDEAVDIGKKERSKRRTAAENEGRREPRDFTDKIKLGGQVFDLEKVSGKKKMAVLPWETFKLARENIDRDSGSAYKGLLGSIRYKNFRLLEGEKLETIIRVQDWLDLEADLGRNWPRSANFEIAREEPGAAFEAAVMDKEAPDAAPLKDAASKSPGAAVNYGNLEKLVANLDHVLQVAMPKGKDKRLGFVTLYTDGAGVFWFRVSKGFHTALNESISSLENLADVAADEKVSAEMKEKIGLLYRKLSAFFE